MSDSRGTQNVSLGCGTLILIALIVLFFSGGGRVSDLEREVRGLRTEIRELRTLVERQSDQLRAMDKKLETLRPLPAEANP